MENVIVKLTLSEQIYNLLKEEILTGRISLGEKITNRELQARFQVSSTPIRDAINKLYQDGLVQDLTKTGAQIIQFDPAYAREVNAFLSCLVCDAMTLSSAEHAREVTEDLLRYEETMRQAGDTDGYFEADYGFHKSFVKHCGNRFLKEAYHRYDFIRMLLIRYAIRTQDQRSAAIEQHRRIAEAYISGDYKLTRQRIQEHFEYGAFLVNQYFTETCEQEG